MIKSPETFEIAEEWCKHDPNPTTSLYVSNLIKQVREEKESCSTAGEELKKLFPSEKKRISFGTAGLRSAMMPGPLGMNDLVVVQAAQGIARYCLEQNKTSSNDPGTNANDQTQSKLYAVVGYDHRENSELQLSSLSFALYTVLVFKEAGIESILLDGFVATPMVPYVMSKTKNCAVGIMVTASHNPKNDAGYKVYWKDGCQIRPPIDTGISNHIAQNLTPWIDYGAALQAQKEKFAIAPTQITTAESFSQCLGLTHPQLTKEMISSYFDSIKSSGLITGQSKLQHKKEKDWVPPVFAYTAMHGVGFPYAKRVFETFGFPPFQEIHAQTKPDPAFPTVSFPNPEEKGALDIAKAVAEETGCDIVLANDPDADRLAVAEKDRQSGEWTVFTGDQIGVMLGHWIWEEIGKGCGKPVAMCASTVSSQMLREIARVEGFHFEETLTGFKWIGSRASGLSQDYRVLLCYEEAIGFCCGDIIFDKDGISALGVFAELTYSVYQDGLNLSKRLQSLYDKYGEFVSKNGYFIMHNPKVVVQIMDHMTCGGKFDFTTVGPYKVEALRFLGEPGYDSMTADKRPMLATSKDSPMLTIRFTNGGVAHFRASGTEPKFKYYIELRGKPGVPYEDVARNLIEMSNLIIERLIKPKTFGLTEF